MISDTRAIIEPCKISMTFYSMLLMKLYKQTIINDDPCSKKIIGDLIVRLNSIHRPTSKLSKKMFGGSSSNNENSKEKRRYRSSRRQPRQTAANLIAETQNKIAQQSIQLGLKVRSDMHEMYLQQIKKMNTGLTLEDHVSIMTESVAKASIPAFMVKFLIMFTIEFISGTVNGLKSAVKQGTLAVTGVGSDIVSGTVQNIGPLNLGWNLLTTANSLLVKGSEKLFSSNQTSNIDITNYVKNADKATDSIIGMLSNVSFSTRIGGSAFVLCALICYNFLVFMKKREIMSKGKEAKDIILRITKMEKYHPSVDYTLSDTILNMAPIAAGIGAMSFSGNPQYAIGMAGLTNTALKRATETRRQRQRNLARIQREQPITTEEEPFHEEELFHEKEQLEQVLPLHPKRGNTRRRRQRSPNESSNNLVEEPPPNSKRTKKTK